LELATKHRLENIAFPAISTGVYGYPISDAAEVRPMSAPLHQSVMFMWHAPLLLAIAPPQQPLPMVHVARVYLPVEPHDNSMANHSSGHSTYHAVPLTASCVCVCMLGGTPLDCSGGGDRYLV
jgi:hypothetical protein